MVQTSTDIYGGPRVALGVAWLHFECSFKMTIAFLNLAGMISQLEGIHSLKEKSLQLKEFNWQMAHANTYRLKGPALYQFPITAFQMVPCNEYQLGRYVASS